MEMPNNKKIIVITGASKGLGRALATKLINPESVLVLCARNVDKFRPVCAEIKKTKIECYWYKVDISHKKEISGFIRKILKKFSKIDVMINNAGATHKKKPIETISDKELDLCVKTNFNSVFYALREIIPAMKKRGAGTIVTISSTAGKRGNPDFAAYSASKFAVTGLMQSAARYLDGSGVRCLTIFPSGINTAMRKYILGAKDAQKQQSPESAAEMIKKCIENPAEFPHGSEIVIRDSKIIN